MPQFQPFRFSLLLSTADTCSCWSLQPGKYEWQTYKEVYDIVMKVGNSIRSCGVQEVSDYLTTYLALCRRLKSFCLLFLHVVLDVLPFFYLCLSKFQGPKKPAHSMRGETQT